MSKIQCDSCYDLREYAPEFSQNGVTDTVCASLKNDTGLNPSSKHTNCDDLHDANDCLIGHMPDTLNAYDVCGWKDFMGALLPNMYEMQKAMICSDCGQWSNIHSLDDRLSDLCGMVTSIMYNQMDRYGILTGEQLKSQTKRMGGEIVSKDGQPALINEENDTDGNWNSVGIWYSRMKYYDCNGKRKTYEWIQPNIRDYRFGNNVSYGDVIWRADTATLKGWGVTDHLINELTNWEQWWDGYGRSFGERRECTLHLKVVDGYLQMKVIGSLGALGGMVVNGFVRDPHIYIS